MHFLDRFLADQSLAYLKRQQRIVDRITAFEPELKPLSNQELRERADALRAAIAEKMGSSAVNQVALLDAQARLKEKKRLNDILTPFLPEAFALVREAAQRTVGQRHFDMQMLGGIVLHQGDIAEMRTGEGKTLVATLPLFLNSLAGRGAHLITVNDYLAQVAVKQYGPIYTLLGASVGIIGQQNLSLRYEDGDLVPVDRRTAYGCDITYGTNNEFGFDYLRDNMAQEPNQLVQRGLMFAIVDEVDSILIDEARTPLIISGSAEESGDLYKRFAQLVPRLKKDQDYTVDEKDRAVSITAEGITTMEQLLGIENIYSPEQVTLAYHLDQALKAQALFNKDKEYVVRDGEVIIVDDFTGRLMPGRRYSEGLHQAIEAKEGVEVQRESITLATISFQNLFRLYPKLSGMTGTAKTEAEEFTKIYGLEVYSIPTNRPMVRIDNPDRIYSKATAKYKAVIAEIKELNASGRPVLVGTASIAHNELLSGLLDKASIKHQMLNAKQHEREAHIIAEAGRKGGVTLATNMAGRGTDIVLGGAFPQREDFDGEPAYAVALQKWQKDHDEVVALGGLHVIGTERHESRRIDNQLRGRAGRQGDPGSSRFYLSAEDDLMRIFGGERMQNMLAITGMPEDEALEHKTLSKIIETAQKRVEGHNFDMRKRVVEYDDVMNRHREVIYRRRSKVLHAGEDMSDLESTLQQSVEHEVRRMVGQHASGNKNDWNLDRLLQDAISLIGLSESESQQLRELLDQYQSTSGVEEKLQQVAGEVFDHKRLEYGDAYASVLKAVSLRTVDMLWVEHLTIMQNLRESIGLQSYAQTDPLVAYKSEGYRLFQQLLTAIDQQMMRGFFWSQITPVALAAQA